MHIRTAPPQSEHQAQPSHAHPSSKPAIWVLGPVPPPTTGMTVLTNAVLQALQQAGTVQFLNWSPGIERRTLRMRWKRNIRILTSLARLIAHGRVRNQRLYLVSNSFSGLYLTGLLLVVAKRLGYTVYLHHHVYYYIDRKDWRMAWIIRRMGPRDVHVVHHEKMAQDLRDRYPTQSGFITVYPSIVVTHIARPRESSHRPFRLGLLSNLSTSKGLGKVVDTLVELANRQRDISLTLAGPVPTSDARSLIDQTIASHSGRVRSIGPVYGDDKAQFFNEIDAFLFPTVSESWGLVLNEALAAGVPVITFKRGCTATVVGTRIAGLLIDPETSDFVTPAAIQIEQWMDDDQKYREASQAAIAQAELLFREGRRSLADFVGHMFSDSEPIS